MTPTAQLAVSLATIAMSGVMSAFVTYKLTKRKEDRAIKRQKLEQLYLAAHKYLLSLETHYSRYLEAMHGTITIDHINKKMLEEGVDKERPYETAIMLQSIYFPELVDFFRDVEKVRHAAQIQIEGFREHLADGAKNFDGFIIALAEDHEDIQKLSGQLIQRVRKIAPTIM